ncbi:MAG: hypothetical protein JWO32_1655 [Bacteroidetes bacterium]|nr:hypothetical protein [Bacteroidota bacterium]
MWSLQNNQFIKFLFYGNYFYGLCAIALSIEAALQQQFPLNPALYYILIFCITVVYYSRAYIIETTINSTNERTLWYARYKTLVIASQITLTIAAVLLSIFFICTFWQHLLNINALEVALVCVFPVTGLLYYGVSGTRYSLRNIGWLKPFVIGFAWAGLVTFYPIIFYSIQQNIEFKLTTIGGLLFLKNFMFISVLCIMFDIKDYASDSGLKVNTFVVNVGLRKTIFFIIIPLCVLGLGTFILYGITRNFHILKITLNVLPFVLLLITAYSLHTRRSLLYYLMVVDGLMLVKAFCGSMAVIYF